MMLTEGQMSDHKGARLMFNALPKAKTLIADKGYDSSAFRDALKERGTEPCIPPRRNRKTPIDYDKALYKQRHKVENLFAKLKDWRRIATRYDRCAHTFFSAICIAAALAFFLNQCVLSLVLQLRILMVSDSLGHHDSAWGSWDGGSFDRDDAGVMGVIAA
jgi:transposase